MLDLYGYYIDNNLKNQYVTFTRIYNEQVKRYGRTREAVLETIAICKDENVLKEYLGSREQEVVSIMMSLFDDEYILKTYVADKEKEAAKKAALKFYKKGVSIEDIADSLDVPKEEVEEWLGLSCKQNG